MGTLTEIENLPGSRRSSLMGRSGVRAELQAIESAEAFRWLEAHIASPVSRDWGQLLFLLNADASLLTHWLGRSKEHALAAADAIADFNESGNVTVSLALVPDLRTAVATHGSPRLKTILETVERTRVALNKPLPSAALARAEALLSNGLGTPPHEKAKIIAAQQTAARWHALFHAVDGVHCVVVLDWSATVDEQADSIQQLPIWRSSKEPLEVQAVDFGNDEIILVALPSASMQELQRLAAGVQFAAVRLAA